MIQLFYLFTFKCKLYHDKLVHGAKGNSGYTTWLKFSTINNLELVSNC